MALLWSLFFLLFPALIIYLCQRFSLLDKVGAAVLCYLAGLIIGNTGLLPAGINAAQDVFLNYSIPVALPLLFFSIDIKGWKGLAGKALLSFACCCVAVLISATLGYLLFRRMVGDESWKVAGMLIGCYTGGTPNLAAIGTALRVDPTIYVATNVADMLIPPIYLLMAMTVLQRILLLFLTPFQPPVDEKGDAVSVNDDFTSYKGILGREKIVPLLQALLLSIVIFGIGGGLSLAVPKSISMVVAVLSIVTMGVLCSLLPRIRRIEMTFQAGQYLILVFCLAVSSLADVSKLVTGAPALMGFVAVAVFVAASIHVLLARLLRIDADTMIITSIAGIFSPPFVPMVAAALKNRYVLVSGIITGIIGWVIGTYLGISYAYVLQSIFQ